MSIRRLPWRTSPRWCSVQPPLDGRRQGELRDYRGQRSNAVGHWNTSGLLEDAMPSGIGGVAEYVLALDAVVAPTGTIHKFKARHHSVDAATDPASQNEIRNPSSSQHHRLLNCTYSFWLSTRW